MINREIEKRNLNTIQKSDQRGERMLSVVDLFEDGTLNRKLIKFLIRRIWSGDSILAAAAHSERVKLLYWGFAQLDSPRESSGGFLGQF